LKRIKNQVVKKFFGDQYDGLGFTPKADEMYRIAEEIKQKSK